MISSRSTFMFTRGGLKQQADTCCCFGHLSMLLCPIPPIIQMQQKQSSHCIFLNLFRLLDRGNLCPCQSGYLLFTFLEDQSQGGINENFLWSATYLSCYLPILLPTYLATYLSCYLPILLPTYLANFSLLVLMLPTCVASVNNLSFACSIAQCLGHGDTVLSFYIANRKLQF